MGTKKHYYPPKAVVTVILGLFWFFPIAGQPQQPGLMSSPPLSMGSGTVRGTVTDSRLGVPLEYASVVIHRLSDSSLVTGSITNASGGFEIQNVPYGKYYAQAQFIGYNTITTESFSVNPREQEVNLPPILLKSSTEDLEAVVVTGQRQMISHNLDKRVFNVGQDITTEGGTALDVMRNIPAVEVDIDGNVKLRGNTNVTILVDGRPSNLTSLDEMPASMIESVEVITNPSARYDPDGLSGIINIVLKRQRNAGYHGMLMLNAGTGHKYSGSVNFNYRQDKVNLFTNINLRQFRTTGSSLSDRTSTLPENSSLLIQDQNFRRGGQFSNLRAGADYFINQHNTLSLSGSLNMRGFNSWEQTQNSNFVPIETLSDSYVRENTGDNDFQIYEVALNYRNNGNGNGRELLADVFYSQFNGDFNSQLNQEWDVLPNQPLLPPLRETSGTHSNSHNLTLQTDLVQPVGNGGRLETGLKGIVNTTDNNYNFSVFDSQASFWNTDNLRSNNFIYNEQIYSAYAIYSIALAPISYQAGLRAEQAFTKGQQLANDELIDRNFLNFYPSAHIKWDINEQNSLQLAYSRRVSRPHIRLLNPFTDYSDPLNISTGNPWLEPEFTGSYELGYMLNQQNTRLTATAFHRNTKNVISRYVTLLPNGVTQSSFRNLNSSLSYGVEGIITQTLTRWWRANINASYFWTQIDGESIPPQAREGYSWTARGTSTWNIGRNLEVQINGNYHSPAVTAGGTNFRFWQSAGGQGRTHEMYWFDLGIRLQVLNRRGTLSLRVSDVLATQRFSSSTFGSNFTTNLVRTHESQVVHLGFSYRINDYRQRRERRADNDTNVMDSE